MPLLTIVYSIALILLGVISYFVTGQESKTAMIPAAFGIVVLIIGILAYRPSLRKTLMHIASALSFLGFLGGLRGIPGFLTLMTGGEVARPAAAVSQTIMSLISLIFFLICMKSFIEARRIRKTNLEAN